MCTPRTGRGGTAVSSPFEPRARDEVREGGRGARADSGLRAHRPAATLPRRGSPVLLRVSFYQPPAPAWAQGERAQLATTTPHQRDRSGQDGGTPSRSRHPRVPSPPSSTQVHPRGLDAVPTPEAT